MYAKCIYILGTYGDVYRNCRRGGHGQACECKDIDPNANPEAEDPVEDEEDEMEEPSNRRSTTEKGRALRSNIPQPEKYSK
jgi:hypothetical protein